MIVLSAKYKLGMVDGTLLRPAATSPLLNYWICYNDIVISWLLNYVSTNIRNNIVYLSTAKMIWDDLARFSQSNVLKLFYLRKEIASLVQGAQSITAYFTKFRTWIDELDNLSSIPRCSCNVCTYRVYQKIELYKQSIKFNQFLMGLSEQYTAIRGQLLLMNPQPTLSQVYSLLLQEKTQMETTIQPNLSESATMSVKHAFPSYKTMKPQSRKSVAPNIDTNLTCRYCNVERRIRDKCFFLHEYPPWHRLYGQPKPKLRNFVKHSAATLAVRRTIVFL